MPPNVQRALAQGASKHGSLRDIEHVVLLMQENRSFDHYFGTLSGVRGFKDPHATNAQKIPSTSHAWQVQHDAWNGGKMDNWLPATPTAATCSSSSRVSVTPQRIPRS
jgi:phospholipase C